MRPACFQSNECWHDVVMMLKGGSVKSAYIERRVSLKLVAYCLAAAMSVFLLFVCGSTVEMVVFSVSAAAWGIAAYREMRCLYVLVMKVEPFGICVMPGFTNVEAQDLATILTELKKTHEGDQYR